MSHMEKRSRNTLIIIIITITIVKVIQNCSLTAEHTGARHHTKFENNGL